jgi:hypothetical protein
METSVHSDLDANLKEGFSQVRVTMPKASLVDQAAGPKASEDPLALPAGRSVHLPGAVALLAQTAMGAAVRSDAAAEGVALEASPAAIRPEVFPAVTPLEASQVVIPLEAFPVAVSRVAMVVGVAEAVDESQLINPKEDRLILFFYPVVDRHC